MGQGKRHDPSRDSKNRYKPERGAAGVLTLSPASNANAATYVRSTQRPPHSANGLVRTSFCHPGTPSPVM